MHVLSYVQQIPALANHDRLGASLFASILAHMVLILLTAFVLPQLRRTETLPTLEITLVQTATERAPEKADVLAQVNQDGGGLSNRPDIARSPLPIRETGERRAPPIHSAPQAPVRSMREVFDFFSHKSETKIHAREAKPDKKDARETPLQLGLMIPSELRLERAQLNAEQARDYQEFQKLPKRKYLNARTQEYKYAAYMEAWRAKVQRVGNLNYPEEAKRRSLQGSLLLAVTVRRDGTVTDITISRSSGHKVIDEAAMRIVKLAAPFSEFPATIRGEADELVITRTWSFNEILTTD